MLDCQALAPLFQSSEKILSLVVHAVHSANSQRAYRRGLLDFLEWYQLTGQQGLNKAVVQEFLVELQRRGLAASSIR